MLCLHQSHDFARSFGTLDLQHVGKSPSSTSWNYLPYQSQPHGGNLKCVDSCSLNSHIGAL